MTYLMKTPLNIYKQITDKEFSGFLSIDFVYDRNLDFADSDYPNVEEISLLLWSKLKEAYKASELDNKEFAEAIDIKFYVDDLGKSFSTSKSKFDSDKSYVIHCIWSQLLYAYGYEPLGTCNSLHYEKICKDLNI